MSSGDISWEEITSITATRICQTYDLTVEGTHNFVAHGLVVHNSHSAAYGLLTYHTAFLKANYPLEFMAALLTVEQGSKEKVSEYVAEMRRMGIEVLPPDINRSQVNFTPTPDGEVLFGLSAIGGISQELTVGLARMREEGGDRMDGTRRAAGPYRDLEDLITAMPALGRKSNTLLALAHAGALDALGERAVIMHNVEPTLERLRKSAKKGAGLSPLFAFDELGSAEMQQPGTLLSRARALELEYSALGIYLSGHPIDEHPKLKRMCACPLGEVEDYFNRAVPDKSGKVRVMLSGIVEDLKLLKTKLGKPMGKFTLSHGTQSREIVVFPQTWARDQAVVVHGAAVAIHAVLDHKEGGEFTAMADALYTAEQALAWPVTERVVIYGKMPGELSSAERRAVLMELEDAVAAHPGTLAAEINLEVGKDRQLIRIGSKVAASIAEDAGKLHWVTGTEILIDDLELLNLTRPAREPRAERWSN